MTDAKPVDFNAEKTQSMLSVTQARARIKALCHVIRGQEQISIANALGRILAQDIQSPMEAPPYDNSAMDGYAICAQDDVHDYTIIGKSFAGCPFSGHLKQGECVRIMTGAKMPVGADTVIMQEHTGVNNKEMHITRDFKSGQNVRYQGEEIHPGDIILQQGEKLGAAAIGVIASLGIAEIKVFRRLRVAFFSTGDELCALGKPLQEGQIYDSNRYTLSNMLKPLPVEAIDMGVIPDQRDKIREAFHNAAELADVVLTSGGVSVGEADYVKETLDELGQVDFWRIAMKPGKPLAFGMINKAFFFGLPGNPVSAMATFYQFAQPALKHLSGERYSEPVSFQVICQCDIRKQAGRMEFQRGILQQDDKGLWGVVTTGHQGSHMLSSMSKANCFILLDQDCAGIKAGEMVTVQPFYGIV
ncbi:MAG: molybdopterin molybdotransferase MoeA [Gammaproteobacteria bacterium]|nr:molybdopterin molybdotransferase MoeA [Gammaproteobacteria bacterium]